MHIHYSHIHQLCLVGMGQTVEKPQGLSGKFCPREVPSKSALTLGIQVSLLGFEFPNLNLSRPKKQRYQYILIYWQTKHQSTHLCYSWSVAIHFRFVIARVTSGYSRWHFLCQNWPNPFDQEVVADKKGLEQPERMSKNKCFAFLTRLNPYSELSSDFGRKIWE